MIRVQLHNYDTGLGYVRKFVSDAEVNLWLMYVQEPEVALGCPKPLAGGTCGCHLKITIIEMGRERRA